MVFVISSSSSFNSLTVNLQSDEHDLIDDRKIFHDHNIYIPERYHIRMMKDGLIDQIIKIINEVEDEQHLLTVLNRKLKHEDQEEEEEENNDDHIDDNNEKYIQINDFEQVYVSIETNAMDSTSIFFDTDEHGNEDFSPGYTYFTKSFYEYDDDEH